MAVDYKNTLNLPQTGFAMKADLVIREPERLKHWETARLYQQIQAARAHGSKFVLHDGPPFANGDVHIGTALNKILKDFIVKYQTLRGKSAPYVPGWDCHGLPIEFKVSQEMRKAGRTDADPVTIRTACEAYARKYIDIQRGQFKRLGVLGDWDQPYLTLNKEYEADELRLFADIVEQGLVYRGKKPVYWSIPCRTALAEAEVEYQDHVSQSLYVKFPVLDRPNTFILIWTTTPWTLPANLAVAFNSTFDYSLVRVGVGEAHQEDYIVSALLLSQVAEKCGWPSYQIVRTLTGEHFKEIAYQHPFCHRTGRLFAGDSFVDNQTGTGFVHIAPGHGLEDYTLGLHQGLPVYSPVDDNGCLIPTDDLPASQQMPADLRGKSILEKHGKSDANEAVLHELRVRQALVHQENYHHSYPHCWRSKTPVIFRAMDQWFIKLDHAPAAAAAETFRARALDEINRVHWLPDWGKSRIEAAVTGRPDWCISRQRSWGVPIPAFYDAQQKPILDARIVRNVADLIERHGSNIWFEKSAADLWALVKPHDWSGPTPVAKATDTLDVWIDSGSSSRAVLMRRAELQHPRTEDGGQRSEVRGQTATDPASSIQQPASSVWQADMYLEGSDQHRGWFQSSLLLSLAGNGAAPYRTVLTHGFMVDADRQKISKSREQKAAEEAKAPGQPAQTVYEKPQTADRYVNEYGADVVRLWVASQDIRNDIVVSVDRIRKVGETYRVIRNALRYELSNLFDFDPARHTVPDAQLNGLDRWILGELATLERAVAAAYDACEFHAVYQNLSQFAAVELSAVYHDLVKDRLYTDPAHSTRRRSTQTALHRLLAALCKMLAPMLAFTADEAWEFIPGKSTSSVHLAEWTPAEFVVPETEQAAWRELFRLREQALPELEKARQAKTIGKSLEAKLTVSGPEPVLAAAQAQADTLRELLNVSQLEFAPGSDGPVAFSVSRADGEKCARCWHCETSVGTVAEHPTICARCAEAVQASGTPS